MGGSAFAQLTLDELHQSLSGWQTRPWIQQQTTVTRGANVQTFQSDLFLDRTMVGTREVIRVELTEQTLMPDGTLRMDLKMVGDGTTLMFMNFRTREWSSVTYGSVEGPQPEHYRARLSYLLGSAPTFRSSSLLRLKRELNLTETSMPTNWVPGGSLENLGAEGLTTTYQVGIPGSTARTLRFVVANDMTNALQRLEERRERWIGAQVSAEATVFTAGDLDGSYTPFVMPAPAEFIGWRVVPWPGVRQVRFADGS